MRERILIVDGHSIIFAWPELAALHSRQTAAARESLVRTLTALQDSTDWSVAVVFDGRGVTASSDSRPDGIAVFYSRSGQTADSLIERLAAKYGRTHEVAVATNDHMERVTIEALGCTGIDADRLRDEVTGAEEELARRIRRLR
jgi:uncharacterized protein